MARRILLDILTPSGVVARTEAVHVVFPASDGQMGVLGGHAPMVARMGAGLVKVEPVDGPSGRYFAAGGFAHVHEDSLTILAEECTPLERISPEEAWDELEAANALPRETPAQEAHRQAAVEAARAKFRLVQKSRPKSEMGSVDLEEDTWD